MTSAESLGAVLARWGHSRGMRGENPLVHVALRYPSAASTEASAVLYEHAATDLRELLELDLAARLGDRLPAADAADLLVLAALRYRYLKSTQVTDRPEADHPRLDSRLAGTLRRLLSAAEEVVAEYGVAWSASSATAELTSRERASLPPRATVPAVHDSATLADQFLLTCVPGRFAIAVHVRVFRPAERPPVVVVGELTDYHSPGLIEEPDAYLADLRGRLPELAEERPRWIHFLPAEYLIFSRRNLDTFDAEYEAVRAAEVREIHLDGDTVRELRPMTPAQLDALVDGSVRRWHGADYHAAGLTAWGVRTVDSVGAAAKAQARAPAAGFRCARRRCGRWFTVPLKRFAEARCPGCGSTKLQPTRLLED